MPVAGSRRSITIAQRGPRCDLGVTIDPARILRVPGTYNRKGLKPRPVVLHALSEKDIDFQAELSKFRKEPPARPVFTPREPLPNLVFFDTSKPPPFTLGIDLNSPEYLAEIGHVGGRGDDLDATILVKDKVGCPMFQQALLTGGADLPQGLWMMQGLACTFVHDGRK